MRRAKEIRGLLIRETYAAIGGMREMLPSAQSNFVRIFIIPHGGAGFRVWMSGLPGFYSEISTCVGSKKWSVYNSTMGAGLEAALANPGSDANAALSAPQASTLGPDDPGMDPGELAPAPSRPSAGDDRCRSSKYEACQPSEQEVLAISLRR